MSPPRRRPKNRVEMAKQPKSLNRAYPVKDNRTVNAFLNEVSDCEILDAQTQSDLVVRAQQGDDKARQRVYESNYKLLVRIANGFQFDTVEADDLIQEGFLGLATAIDGFDPSKGTPFPNYASWWIKKCMLEFVWNQCQTFIRMPENHRLGIRKLLAISSRYLNSTGRVPTMEELMDESKLPESLVSNYCTIYNYGSLNNPVSIESLTEAHMPLDDADDPGVAIDREFADEAVRKCLDVLTERQREIVCEHHGIGSVAKSLDDIAFEHGVSPARVWQCYEGAMKTLRKKCGKMLLPYLEE